MILCCPLHTILAPLETYTLLLAAGTVAFATLLWGDSELAGLGHVAMKFPLPLAVLSLLLTSIRRLTKRRSGRPSLLKFQLPLCVIAAAFLFSSTFSMPAPVWMRWPAVALAVVTAYWSGHELSRLQRPFWNWRGLGLLFLAAALNCALALLAALALLGPIPARLNRDNLRGLEKIWLFFLVCELVLFVLFFRRREPNRQLFWTRWRELLQTFVPFLYIGALILGLIGPTLTLIMVSRSTAVGLVPYASAMNLAGGLLFFCAVLISDCGVE